MAAASSRGSTGRPTGRPASLTAEYFELVPVAGDLAILRLLARIDGPSALPADVCLNIVATGRVRPAVFPAQGGRLERRVQSGRSDRGELLWRAAFGLPLRLAEDAGARFTLTGAGLELALPAPRRRGARAGVPSLGISVARQSAAGLSLSARQRVAALATAMIVTATSSPVAALADGAVGTTIPSGTGSGSAAPAPAVAPSAVSPAADPSAPPAAPAPAATPAPASAPAPEATTPTATTATTAAPAGPAATTSDAPVPSSTPSAAPATSTAAAPAAASPSAAPAASPAPATAPTSAGGRRTGTRRVPAAAESAGRLIADAPVPSHHAALGKRHQVTRLFASRPPRSQRASHHNTRGAGCHTTTSPATITDVAAVAALTGARLQLGTRCATSSQPALSARPAAGRHDVAPGAILEILPAQSAVHPSDQPIHPARPAHRAGAHRRITVTRHHAARPATPGALRPIVTDPATPAPGAAPSSGSVSSLSSAPAGFLVPRAWTGSVTPDPSLSGAVTDLSGLLADGDRPPSFLVPIFMQAGRRYGIPWPVLAAINAIETNYGRNLNTSSAGAIGWMQFEPSTWKRYGLAVDGHSVPNPYDPRDAIFSAARYLAAAGAAHDLTTAIYAYNHAGWYVQDVLQRATAIAHHVQFQRATIRRGTFSVDFATGRRRHPTVTYRGGVLSHFDRLIAAANMVSAAQFPYVWGGGHEEPANFGPFDCSGSVSYVLQQAGYKVPTSVSGNVGQWKFPSGPGRVTIFFNPTHTFMRIGNRFFGTSLSRPGGGAGWIDVNRLPADYLANFAEVHVPRLGIDSFAPHRHHAH